MDNTFLRDAFYWSRQDPRRFRFANRVLRKLRLPFRIAPALDPRRDMTNLEMRINFFHLVQQACLGNIEGDAAEFGSYTGETAALFGEVLRDLAPEKTLHVFDSFEEQYELAEPIRPRLEANLQSRGIRRWEVHQGSFDETVPSQLPDQLCFVNIDCGSGGGPAAIAAHKARMLYLLENIYPRLPRGAVVALTDYCDLSRNESFDANPGVKQAADEFFAGKPERVDVLLAGELSLGCVRKR